MSNSIYKPIIIFFISILFLALFIMGNRPEYYLCLILIFIYLFLYWNVIGVYKYVGSVTGFFISFLTFMRYFVIPILIMFDVNYMTYRPLGLVKNGDYFNYGIYLTIWESIAFGLFIAKKLPKWYSLNIELKLKTTTEIYPWIFLIIVFGALLVLKPSVLANYSLVINLKQDYILANEFMPMGGLADTISIIASRVLKIILPIPIVSLCYKKYKIRHTFGNLIISTIFLVFFYAFILDGNSRNSIIIPAVAVMFILIKLYPRYKKSIITTLLSVILLVTGLSLVWKSFLGDYTFALDRSLSFWIGYIESYYAGVSNMGKAVFAYKSSDVTINPIIMINDIVSNVPFVSKLVHIANTSNYYFFNVWGRSDQVIPATGNGLFYFGYLFSPMVSIIILLIAHYFEKKMRTSDSVPEYIIYCYACAVISYNIFNSVSTMMMKLTITVLPLLLSLYFSRKLSK